MESLEVAPNHDTGSASRGSAPELTKKSIVQKMRRASMAAYLAEAQGIKSISSETSQTPSEKEREGISRREAWGNMVLALIGVMVCFLPNIMSKSGWLIAPPALFVSAFMLIRMGNLICKACELVESAEGSPAGSVKSYEELAKTVGMYKVLMVTKNTVLMASIILGENFLVGALAGLLPFNIPRWVFRWFGIFPAFCLMALLKDLSQLSNYAWVGLVGMGVQLVGLLGGCLLGCFANKTRDVSMMPPEGSVPGMAGITLSAFIFCFAILATVPSVRSQMRDASEMPMALRDAIGFTVILYEVIMIWGYFAYGADVKENFTEDISESFPIFGILPSCGLFANVAITAPLFFYCFFSVVEATGDDQIRTQGSLPNTVARITLALVLTVAGQAVPGLLPVIGVFSSVFCVCNNMFFPILFYTRLRWRAGQPASTLDRALDALIAIVGVLVFVYGLQGSLETLAKEMGWVDASTPAPSTSNDASTTIAPTTIALTSVAFTW